MAKIRVLVVDDSVVIRKIVSDVVSSDDELEVAGIAANGKIALARIPQLNPDLITLDIEMPVMDGIETVKEIRKLYPKLPVVMFSTLTSRGAEATLDALSAGATDYVTKPANVGSASLAIERVREELIPKIKAAVNRGAAKKLFPAKPVAAAPPRAGRIARIDAVCIGISTGGPNALAEMIPALPADLPVPIVIVQHMPPVFTRSLADRLNVKAKLDVREGAEGDIVRPGGAWIAPGGFHMTVARNGVHMCVRLNEAPPENSCRPAADVLFRSVVQAYGPHVLAVVMTGMGQDGLLGCRAIKDAGGSVIVQDEATSVVWGMPGFVAHEGIADGIYPLPYIATEITRRVTMSRTAHTSSAIG